MQILLHNFKTMQILLRKLLPCKLQEPDFRYTTIQAPCFFLGSSNAKPINFSGLQYKASATFQVSNAKTQQLFRSPMQSASNFLGLQCKASANFALANSALANLALANLALASFALANLAWANLAFANLA